MTSDRDAPRVCVVGSGTAFVSGISYYTYYLSHALASRTTVSVILMRRLIPRRLYPGRDRVGAAIMPMRTASFAPTFDGVDWFGLPSLLRALRFLRRQRPDVLVLQWWSGSVLLWYLVLAARARARGCRVILELHEDVDSAEARLPVIGPLILAGLRRLVGWSAEYVVHSRWDQQRMSSSLGLDPARTHVVPHGPYPMASVAGPGRAERVREPDVHTILFFGTIRPYKGLEHLVAAFDALPRDGVDRWKLLVVGETWEGWTSPLEAIAASPHRADIELVNRYVTDEEVPGFFDRADVVALPYLRSSASGPLALTMSRGLPVVVTAVGGLVEAAVDYTGAVLVEPGDAASLAAGLLRAVTLVAAEHRDVVTWGDVADSYERIIAAALGTPTRAHLELVGG